MTYSAQFRKKLLGVMEKEKLTLEEAAKRFDVGSASISRFFIKTPARQRCCALNPIGKNNPTTSKYLMLANLSSK